MTILKIYTHFFTRWNHGVLQVAHYKIDIVVPGAGIELCVGIERP